MLLKVNGHNFFPTGEQVEALRTDSAEKVGHQVDAVKHWLELIAAEDGNNDANLRHEWEQLSKNFDRLAEVLDFFFVVRGHYVPEGALRSALPRDDQGHFTG